MISFIKFLINLIYYVTVGTAGVIFFILVLIQILGALQWAGKI